MTKLNAFIIYGNNLNGHIFLINGQYLLRFYDNSVCIMYVYKMNGQWATNLIF